MYLEFTEEQETLRKQLRAYFEEILDEEGRDFQPAKTEEGRARYRRIMRRLGRDKWLGIGWPTEYGGMERSAIDQYIFYDEAERCGIAVPYISTAMVGPALMEHGSPEQRNFYLPKILAGECDFALGYTEPGAGTDLASLRTTAVRDGDGYLINGQKVFTTGGEMADYIWLAARTDRDAPKHRGISIIIVPTTSKGFRSQKLPTILDRVRQTNMTFYDDVWVTAENLIGEENGGWRVITDALNHERVALAASGSMGEQLLEDVLALGRDGRSGDPSQGIEASAADLTLARCVAMFEAMRLMNLRLAQDVQLNQLSPADSAAVKVFGSETMISVMRDMMAVVGSPSMKKEGSDNAVLAGRLERGYRQVVVNTFGGGANEVMRDMISRMGLGLPRIKYTQRDAG